MVNKERVQLLVDELMSTDKPQGEGFLNANGNFCCLGIACEVAIANGLELKVGVGVVRNRDSEEVFITYNDTNDVLPEAVKDWYGFDSADPKIAGTDEEHSPHATVANDDFGWDFKKIAAGFAAQYLKE